MIPFQRSSTRLLRPAALLLASLLSACAGGRGLAPMSEASPCREHCQTHSEGYQWAQSSNLDDPRICDSYPAEFARGCRDGVEDLRGIRPYSQGI
ncbi:hypothetical protein AAG565_03980 [Fontimonas sp. SYSU GA230001]|uniref:hypothetical protein n=1 Tax=Fontimonas sp. SYSU GA230001 TaxID=3142450 RepID=UPI0032B426AC